MRRPGTACAVDGAAGSVGVQRSQRQVVDGRRLARDAVVVHRIHAIGGDVHLEEVPVAGTKIVHAFDRDAAQGQVFGELAVVDGNVAGRRSGASC